MSTYVPVFQGFLVFLRHYVLAKLATSSIRVKGARNLRPLGEITMSILSNSVVYVQDDYNNLYIFYKRRDFRKIRCYTIIL